MLRLLRLAVPAPAGLLGPGGLEGFPGGRGRPRAGERRDGRRQGGGALRDVAVARQIARYLKNHHYPSDEAYLYAFADVMAREYRAIVDAGFVLQLDCPDLALSRHMVFAHLSLAEFRKAITTHVEALNHAVKDIRPIACACTSAGASTQGPHHKDVPLADIVDIVLRARRWRYCFPAPTRATAMSGRSGRT